MLSTSPTAAKGLLQRARASLAPEVSGPEPAPGPGSAAERALAQRFSDAFLADDIDAIVALLTDDAWLAMPPAPHEYHGPDAVAAFLRASAAWRGRRALRLVATRANTQPAFATYLAEPGEPARPTGLLVLALAGGRIGAITRFLDPGLPAAFGLEGDIEQGQDEQRRA
jgi:hypothetical protein